jgi:putative NADH-flavin reductase
MKIDTVVPILDKNQPTIAIGGIVRSSSKDTHQESNIITTDVKDIRQLTGILRAQNKKVEAMKITEEDEDRRMIGCEKYSMHKLCNNF